MHLYILGSPRTGSTVLYQLLCRHLKDYYFINNAMNNDYPKDWINYILKHMSYLEINKEQLSLNNQFGKTKLPIEPSEGSNIFRYWFGGGHPSESVSYDFCSNDTRSNFIDQHQFIQEKIGSFIITKNAWNCFRIRTLAKTNLPILFIWIRRGLKDAALSDLNSRYRQGNPDKVWNSASPANYFDLLALPYYQQVVEQQYEYNQSMKNVFMLFPGIKMVEIWFEELCKRPFQELKKIINFLPNSKLIHLDKIPIKLKPAKKNSFLKAFDIQKIDHHIDFNRARFNNLFKYI